MRSTSSVEASSESGNEGPDKLSTASAVPQVAGRVVSAAGPKATLKDNPSRRTMDSRLDDKEYRMFTRKIWCNLCSASHFLTPRIVDDGTVANTCGALLPKGYKKSADPEFPWICPVRSCRVMTRELVGLGKHWGVCFSLSCRVA